MTPIANVDGNGFHDSGLIYAIQIGHKLVFKIEYSAHYEVPFDYEAEGEISWSLVEISGVEDINVNKLSADEFRMESDSATILQLNHDRNTIQLLLLWDQLGESYKAYREYRFTGPDLRFKVSPCLADTDLRA